MMSYVSVGSCPKCGAPIYAESPYWSTLPPTSVHTCNCASPMNYTITYTTNTTSYVPPQTVITCSSWQNYPQRVHEVDISDEIALNSTYDHLHLEGEEE